MMRERRREGGFDQAHVVYIQVCICTSTHFTLIIYPQESMCVGREREREREGEGGGDIEKERNTPEWRLSDL